MFGRLLILFITIPMVEIILLMWVSSRIHWSSTLMLVVLTGAWGAYLARSQGYSILARIQSELAAGRDRGPLPGIPYGVKDLLATRGIPTSWGAAPMKDRVIDADATVIVRLREAGAVLAAKLAMVEIAGGLGYKQSNASFTGAGLNPWDTGRWAGGSSSGPGSAIGAGLVPFAIGSETWGSIMTPAGFCGITGLRPTCLLYTSPSPRDRGCCRMPSSA